MMKMMMQVAASAAVLLGACADKDDIRSRLEVEVNAEVTLEVSSEVEATPTDTTAEATPETTAETTGDAPQPEVEVQAETTQDATPQDVADVVVPPWEVDPDAPWALGRPIPIAGSEGPAEVAAPITPAGQFAALVAVRIGGGSVMVDGRTFAAPDTGGHAALVALSGELEAPALSSVVYLDGPLSAPERPSIAVCGDHIYASINEQNGSGARLVRLSLDLESIDVAAFAALPGLGHSVKLGAPVCGGPGFVVTLDAVGGAAFTAPDGDKAEFSAAQTENKSLILNGTRVFVENAAQVVSANSMRILHILSGPAQVIFYVGEATVQRQIGDTTLLPGDQLVYNHDYAVGSGGSIASQGWFGREDISFMTTAPDGRFAVAWVDVTPGATANDPELVEVVVSVFEADGARTWNKRSASWAIDRMSFDDGGDLRIAGRFRSLEVIGVATAPVGPEDAFLAVLGGADGARKRHVVSGVPGVASTVTGPIFDAAGSGACTATSLDAVFVASGTSRVAVGVGDQRCATQALTANDSALLIGMPITAGDASDAWLAFGGALNAGQGSPWPAGTNVGPIRMRFVSPL